MSIDYRVEAIKLAALLQTVVEMSDDVTRGQGAIDMQGRLLRLQSSIQKNKPRLKPIFARILDAEKADGVIGGGKDG